MTPDMCLRGLEEAYGEYTPFWKRAVKGYLFEAFTEDELDTFFDLVMVGYSGKFKYPPDIAELERIRKEREGELAIETFGKSWLKIREARREKDVPRIEEQKRPDDKEVAGMLDELSEYKKLH